MADTQEALALAGFVATADEETYHELVGELRQLCLGPDNGRHARRRVDLGSGPVDMTAGRLLANLVLFYPYRLVAEEPPVAERAVTGPMDSRTLEGHLDATIAELYGRADPADLSMAAASSSAFLADLSSQLAGRVGTSVSVRALLEACEADPRIRELLNFRAPAGDLGDIELAADAAGAELSRRLSALGGEYGRLIRCGAAINQDQLRQALVTVGVKPGLADGELIPEPIDTSFLRGMRNAQDMYICAIGARKALTTNHRQVKNSGYLARKLVLLVSGHRIDPDVEDCGGAHAIEFEVQSEAHAERLEGRWACMEDELEAGRWVQRSAEGYKALVGKRGWLRGPVTCCAPNGVCRVCYGELSRANASVHAGVYGTLVISEQITQRLLSSKHLLKARPTPMAWPEGFMENFSVERASVVPESSVDKIWIDQEDVDVEEGDEGEERRVCTAFSMRTSSRRSIRFDLPSPIYLDDDAWGDAEEDADGVLAISPQPEQPVFEIPVANTDLSQSLYAIRDLIERDENTDIDVMYGTMLHLLVSSKMHTPSIHAEMIIRALVRSAEDVTKRPDFSTGPDRPAYQILKLPAAILASPSVTNSLSFERVKAQLTSVEVLDKRGTGVMDAMFGA